METKYDKEHKALDTTVFPFMSNLCSLYLLGLVLNNVALDLKIAPIFRCVHCFLCYIKTRVSIFASQRGCFNGDAPSVWEAE